MRILYTNFHPRNGGGHATYVANLARSFQGEHQVTVTTPSTSRLFAQASRIPGVRCVDASFSTRPGPMLAEVIRLRRLLREGAYDLVHVNGSADHRQAMLARLGLRRPPRMVAGGADDPPMITRRSLPRSAPVCSTWSIRLSQTVGTPAV